MLLKKLNPKLLILIDFPDFNFIIASVAKKLGVPILYYITPQLWAWRKNRIKKIKKLIDKVAVILPFEEEFYRKHNVNATFVGHPLLDISQIDPESIDYSNIINKSPIIGLFPGSRNKEISKLLPTMLKSAKIIQEKIPSASFIVSHSNSIDDCNFKKIISKYNKFINIEIDHKAAKYIFKKCSCVIAASGTVTLEAALNGMPSIIIYKVSAISYLIGRILVNVEHIGLVNLILGEKVVPELIQHQADPVNIAKTTISLIKNKRRLIHIRKQVLCVKNFLGKPGASERVSSIAMDMID